MTIYYPGGGGGGGLSRGTYPICIHMAVTPPPPPPRTTISIYVNYARKVHNIGIIQNYTRIKDPCSWTDTLVGRRVRAGRGGGGGWWVCFFLSDWGWWCTMDTPTPCREKSVGSPPPPCSATFFRPGVEKKCQSVPPPPPAHRLVQAWRASIMASMQCYPPPPLKTNLRTPLLVWVRKGKFWKADKH